MSTTTASTTTVLGVTLTRVPLGYSVGDFTIEYDEHDGAWLLYRTDRAPFDVGIVVNGEPRLESTVLLSKLESVVKLLVSRDLLRVETPDFIRDASASASQRSFSGLTLWQLVLQSYLCHPDWDVDTHIGYASQEFADPTYVTDRADVIAWWLTTNAVAHPAGILGRSV